MDPDDARAHKTSRASAPNAHRDDPSTPSTRALDRGRASHRARPRHGARGRSRARETTQLTI